MTSGSRMKRVRLAAVYDPLATLTSVLWPSLNVGHRLGKLKESDREMRAC